MRLQPHVRVGVGVLIFRGRQLLVGKRKGSHGAGEYALPGGHLELGESWEDCATREVLEETGLHLQHVHFVFVTNNMVDNGSQYVTIFMRGDASPDAEPQLREPEKCEDWQWCHWPDVPQPAFGPLRLLLQTQYQPDEPSRITAVDDLSHKEYYRHHGGMLRSVTHLAHRTTRAPSPPEHKQRTCRRRKIPAHHQNFILPVCPNLNHSSDAHALMDSSEAPLCNKGRSCEHRYCAKDWLLACPARSLDKHYHQDTATAVRSSIQEMHHGGDMIETLT